MMRRLAISKSFQRGVAAVEAALLVIPLVILAFGIVDGGRAFYQYNTLVKSTRDAVRYLSTVAPGTGDATATCLTVAGTPCPAALPLVEGLDASNVSISRTTVPSVGNGGTATGVVSLVEVRVSGFRYVSIVGLSFPSTVFRPISATMRAAL